MLLIDLDQCPKLCSITGISIPVKILEKLFYASGIWNLR